MSERDLQRAGQIVIDFRHSVQECNLDRIAAFVKRILTEELWRARTEGVPERLYKCESPVEFITTKPIKGCGWPLDKITLLLRQAGNEEVLHMWRKATTGPKHKHHDGSNSTIKPMRGTTKAYTLDRLERERPDLYERVLVKELSANAAAIEAGWRKKLTALELLQKTWAKASEAERAAFRATIMQPPVTADPQAPEEE